MWFQLTNQTLMDYSNWIFNSDHFLFCVRTPHKPVVSLLAEDNFIKLIIREHLPLDEVCHQFGAVYRSTTGKLPDHDALDLKLRSLFTRKRDEIRAYLARPALSKLSLSLEAWSSAGGLAFLITTAHVMNEAWEPVRFVLDCILLAPDVTADTIREHLVALVEEYQCGGKIVAVSAADERDLAGAEDEDGGGVGALVSQAVDLYKIDVAHGGGMI